MTLRRRISKPTNLKEGGTMTCKYCGLGLVVEDDHKVCLYCGAMFDDKGEEIQYADYFEKKRKEREMVKK